MSNQFVAPSHHGGWTIDKDTPDTYQLKHPHYVGVRLIVSFDEACRIRAAIVAGGQTFIHLIRGYENFLITFQKMMQVSKPPVFNDDRRERPE